MDKIDNELTKEEKKFLEKMFGNRSFLQTPEAKRYMRRDGEETFGETFSSYILRGPPEVRDDDDSHHVFNSAWGYTGDPIDFVHLDGFTYTLLFKALIEGKGTSLENELETLLDELNRTIGKPADSIVQYAFTQFLSLLYARELDAIFKRKEEEYRREGIIENGMTCKPSIEVFSGEQRRLIHIEEDGIRYMIRCAEYVKNLLRVFTFDTSKQLERYLQDPEWKTQTTCYRRYYVDGDKQKMIAADLGIDTSTVSKYVDRVEGKLSHDLGAAYEEYYATFIAPTKFETYEKKGGIGEPDGIGHKDGQTWIISIKCYDSLTHRTIERSALNPEIEYAKQLIAQGEKNVKAILHFHINSSSFTEEREIDLNNPDEKYTFNPR